MTYVFGFATIAIGLAYLGLGTLSAVELIVLRKERGFSRFAVGFTLMAASCGPHHLAHGWHILSGMDHNALVAVSTVVGLPCGLIFVGLRLEAMIGGRGDRFVSGSPWWITVAPLTFLVVVGALGSRGLGSGAHVGHDRGSGGSFDPTSLVFLTNLFVTVTYGLVGGFLLRTQVRRRQTSGGWSLSGLSLAGVFPTCALMHLVYALTARGNSHTLFFDLLGVPASIYFLAVVRGLYRDSIVDWNRRPLVGRAGTPSRPSPWQAKV